MLFSFSDILHTHTHTHVRKHLVVQGRNSRISESDKRKLKLVKIKEGEFNLSAEYCAYITDGALMQVCHQ